MVWYGEIGEDRGRSGGKVPGAVATSGRASASAGYGGGGTVAGAWRHQDRLRIGTDHDTAAFAVASIRHGWQAVGRHDYPGARRLLITADGGGSNGCRTRGWKTQLADLAAETGLEITVCHLPAGTSKWNKSEYRLFSHITMNWRGRPLTSHEVMLQTIAATTSRTGLTVQAEFDSGEYPTGVRVSDDEITALPITRHRFHGDWNYTLHPQRPTGTATTTSTQDEAQPDGPARLTRRSLQDPELTGMTRRQLNELIDVLTPAMEIQREQVLDTRRGHGRLVAPGTGAKPKLTSADRVLATVLHLRKLATMISWASSSTPPPRPLAAQRKTSARSRKPTEFTSLPRPPASAHRLT
ncbi:ISAzo13 family transposase [Streptomyces sp. GF20]|nr:ISAzo13 family transposase [Streptomyces sp. GF20]